MKLEFCRRAPRQRTQSSLDPWGYVVPPNRAALRSWLRSTPAFRVSDLNLLPPHDRLDQLVESIQGVDLLKLNVDEAQRLMPDTLASASVATYAAQLAANYNCATVCITLGA